MPAVTASSVVAGRSFTFTVVAKNAAGVVVPASGRVIVTSGNAIVSSDGSGGVFTAPGLGAQTLTVTDGKLIATLPVAVTPDMTPASLEVATLDIVLT